MTTLDPLVPAWGPVRPTTALVVASDSTERSTLASLLLEGGYDVGVAAADDAPARIERDDPDLVVLSVGASNTAAVALCGRIRELSDAYVVMIGGRDEESDTLAGLAAGADEYLSASCSTRELMARVHVLTRRPRRRGRRAARARAPRRRGDVMLDPSSRQVTVNGQRIHLTKLEFDLLAALTDQPGKVLSRRALLDRVWGPDRAGDDHVVDVHIANLRKKIDIGEHRHIATVRGVGYRLN